MLWDAKEVQVRLVYAHKFFLHVEVRSKGGLTWEMTEIYASLIAHKWRHIWNSLDSMVTTRPWMIIRDFNCVLEREEHSLGVGESSNFMEWVERRGLIDLGYTGPKFTWKHGSNEASRRATRLDRSLGDDNWRRLFPATKVRHLAHAHSDHCSLLLQLYNTEVSRMGERPFRFHATWLLHRDFSGVVERERKYDGNLPKTLRSFSEKLQAWNRQTFGNIFRKKWRNQLRLEGV